LKAWIRAGLLLAGLGAPAPGHGDPLPGVWLLQDEAGEPERRELVVGGSAQQPPEAPEQICLSWSWRDARPDLELYPDAAAGEFLETHTAWSLDAAGDPAGGPCRPIGAFPRLGVGPARELWLLAPPGMTAQYAPWADLLDAVEAAWRQSTPAPLAERTVGTLERCAVRSRPVPAETHLDRWLPVELPRPAGEAAAGAGAGGRLRSRRFLWWLEPPAGGEECAAEDRGTLRLFPQPGEAAAAGAEADSGESKPAHHLVTVAGVEWLPPGSFDLDPGDSSPRLRSLRPADSSGAAEARETEVPAGGPVGAAESPAPLWQGWALGAGAMTALAALIAAALARGRRPAAALDADARKELRRLVDRAVDRRLRALGAGTPVAAAGDGEPPAPEHEQRLAAVADGLFEQLRIDSAALAGELKRSLRREAQSLSEGLRQDAEAETAPCRRLRREIQALPDGERGPLAATLDAAGRLGRWVERLWPVLEAAAERDVESIARQLPEPAAGEWRHAARVLRAFAQTDAVALSRLARNGAGGAPPPAETAFLEGAGLLSGERPVAERLKRYLEPFDHLGRLGDVTLALQYLVEAFPIEQLPQERRAVLRRVLSQTQLGAGMDDDFHPLVSAVAAGIGLRYRPVPLYRSRTDDSDYAFVRQQVSPISLSERVGFEATADKEAIVRLERPFFFQRDTGIYYAGHAHVAR
jgi:hypothetical protein